MNSYQIIKLLQVQNLEQTNFEIRNKIYRIQIWDTSGQENFRTITRAYYKNSVCAIIIYDIKNRVSFEYFNNQIEDIKNSSKKNIIYIFNIFFRNFKK